MLSWLHNNLQTLGSSDQAASITLLFMLAAATITGIAKSGFGGGIGILAVPLIANAMRADVAIGVMLPVLIAADVFAVSQHHQHCSKPKLRAPLVGATIGIGLASLLLLTALNQQSDEQLAVKQLLGGAVGVVCLLMVGIQIFKACGGKIPDLPQSASTAGFVGAFAGFTSTLAHAAGPIMSIYWLQAKLPKAKLIGSLVVFFLLVNSLKLLPYIFVLGLINQQTLKGSLIMLPAVPIGACLGWWMQKRIPEKPFAWVMYTGVLLASGRLVWQAFR